MKHLQLESEDDWSEDSNRPLLGSWPTESDKDSEVIVWLPPSSITPDNVWSTLSSITLVNFIPPVRDYELGLRLLLLNRGCKAQFLLKNCIN